MSMLETKNLVIIALTGTIVALLGVIRVMKVENGNSPAIVPVEPGPWQQCSIFEAPSLTVPGTGVFAATRFKKYSLVWFFPLYVRVDNITFQHVLQDLILDHYMLENDEKVVIGFGSAAMANHHTDPNVQYIATRFDGDPGDSPLLLGFQALRDIEPGEEIFWDYTMGEPGDAWFATRGLTESKEPHSRSRRVSWEADATARCSKLVVGVGRESLQRINAVAPKASATVKHFNALLPPRDHGWGGAITRSSISAGELLETDTMLVLPADKLRNTILAPLMFDYNDFTPQQQQSLLELRKRGIAKMYYNKGSRVADSEDIWEDHNVALIPMGNIVMVRRVGHRSKNTNCEVVLAASESGSLEMQLRATRNLQPGEMLFLAFPEGGRPHQNLELMSHIMRSGQPTPTAWKEFVYTSTSSQKNSEL